MTFSPSCCHFLHRLFLYNLDRRDSRDENLSNSVVKTLTRMLIHFSSRYVTRSKGVFLSAAPKKESKHSQHALRRREWLRFLTLPCGGEKE